ncbi:MAG: hypothetical protein AB8B71_08905 [Paracoccaceae bacterium]
MANINSPIPKAIRNIQGAEEDLGLQFIKLALMDPSELRNPDGSAFTISQFRAKFSVFNGLLDFSDFVGEEDNHTMVFNQGSATEHHFSLASLNKLVPMIEGYLERSLADYIDENEMRNDIDLRKPFPTEPSTDDYPPPRVYEDVFLPPGAEPLNTQMPEYFHKVVAEYAHKGCRG